jgi:hypothetical protein
VSGSDDGGATWRLLKASMSGIPLATHLVKLNDLEVGPDGHVYAATYRFLGEGDGLYRSVDPVYAVASGPAPTVEPFALTVAPNPSNSQISVALSSTRPGRVRVTVLDVRGRVVVDVFDGDVRNTSEFAVDTSRLAPGVYVARAEMEGNAVASASFTVVR